MKKVSVYLDNGLVFEYEVADENKGREHAYAIIATGYRHTDGNGDLEWFPPHRISKIKVESGAESSRYLDKTRAT